MMNKFSKIRYSQDVLLQNVNKVIFVKSFYNLRVASCELRVASYDFEKINLRVVSSFLQVEKKFYELEILRVGNKTASSKLFL